METVLEITNHHTNYWKKEHVIDSIIIKEIKSRNPHIKVNTQLFRK